MFLMKSPRFSSWFFLCFFFLGSASSAWGATIEILSAEVASDSFSRDSLADWRQILAGEKFPALKNFAPHAILRIQPSRLQARLLAQTYEKSKNGEDKKENHDLRFAILNELVKTNLVTVMDDWQKEVTSTEFNYDERLILNFLSRRDGTMRSLYKESTLVKANSCSWGRKALKIELRKKVGEADKDYFWIVSGFHIYFTGIGVDGAGPENLPDCEDLSFFKFSNLEAGVFWEKSGGYMIAFESRYFRPINYFKLKDREELTRISRQKGDRLCFLANSSSAYPHLKKSWLCKN
ncbi:MAG: hypothetical protein A4S09_05455 [Proteobacteria bacterium SG_bin7]|nr:MAG: hypothetical protein A4S09_05455 [Proteobacteria bacterium SG_bin7]